MTSNDPRRIPRDQVKSVVTALYAAADRLDWEHLSANARTDLYDEWTTDSEIGGVLTKYMSSENARSWIKDGPMKEYGRARLGAGRYAEFGSSAGLTPESVVTRVLGPTAQIIPNSFGVKPLHCLAEAKGATTYVAWDAAKNLRHLVWAAVNHLSIHTGHTAVVVLLETLSHPITQSEKVRHSRIAERCSITIAYYRVATSRPTRGADS